MPRWNYLYTVLTASAARRRLGLIAALLVLLSIPAVALAGTWSHQYAYETYFNAGGIALSDFNSNIGYNQIIWGDVFAPPDDVAQLTLCDASYQCYDYKPVFSGNDDDFRSIAYGRAKCNAYQYNANAIYVENCYTNNF